MRIGELASRTRTAASAIRFYEAEGLLPGSRRSPNGYRDYEPAAVGRVEFIRRAQSLGLRITQIRQLVSGPAGSRDEERQRLRHAVAHQLAEARRRQAELAELSVELERIHVQLQRPPAPTCGHVGDCACWLATEEEVMAMTSEVSTVEQGCCENGCCENGDGAAGTGCC